MAVLLLLANTLGSLHALEFHVEEHHHHPSAFGEYCNGSEHHSCALDQLLRVPVQTCNAAVQDPLPDIFLGNFYVEKYVSTWCPLPHHEGGPPRAPPGLLA